MKTIKEYLRNNHAADDTDSTHHLLAFLLRLASDRLKIFSNMSIKAQFSTAC